jgi:branched-chain amino acid transport system substrate-binding protein
MLHRHSDRSRNQTRGWHQRALLFGVAVSFLTLTASACGGGSQPAASSGGVTTVLIGYSNSLTGDFAVYGQSDLSGSQLAIDEVNKAAKQNGFRIQLVTRDDRTDPKQGTIIAQGFCDDSKIQAVLGFNWSTLLLAAMPIYGQCGLPVVATETSSPTLSGLPFLYRVILSDAITGAKISDQAVKVVGATRLAVFNPNDDYGKGVAGAAISEAEKDGATIAYHFQYADGTKDFRAAATKLRGLNVDAILLLGYYADGAAIVEQARSLGVTAPFVASQSMRAPDFLKLAGGAAEGAYVASDYEPAASPQAQAFNDAYTARYGKAPDTSAALGYDSVWALADALKKAKSYTRADIHAAMAKVSVQGLTGHLAFDQNGDVTRELYWVQVKGGQFVPVTASP